jgi:heptosyltransferase-2
MPDPERIAIVAPNWLGDAVMALPAIDDVRRRFPAARISVAARPSVASLFALVPCVDEVIALQWRGRIHQRRAFSHDADRLRQANVDAAILLTNSFATAWLLSRAGASERWGYATDLRRPLLTRAIRRPSGSVHQGAYYQYLTTALGAPAGPLEPSVTVRPEASDAARALLASRGWRGRRRVVVLAPGAAYGTAKRWLPSHFATLIARLVRDRDAHCVLVGSAADGETTRAITSALDADVAASVIDLTGATTLEMLTAILGLADACVSNDSGAMHLAAAAGAPLAALFGPTRDRETAPLTRGGGRAEVLINPVWCRPCMLRECPIDHRCMRGLDPSRVFASVSELMSGAPGRHAAGSTRS